MSKLFLSLLVIFGLMACETVLNPGPSSEHPVVNALLINDETGSQIVSQSGVLTLEVDLKSEAELVKVEILANEVSLVSFAKPPYRHEWDITAANNGFYNLRVIATDIKGSSVSVSFPNRLAINIDLGVPLTDFAVR